MQIFGSGLTKEFGFGVWLVSRYLSLPDGWMRWPNQGPIFQQYFISSELVKVKSQRWRQILRVSQSNYSQGFPTPCAGLCSSPKNYLININCVFGSKPDKKAILSVSNHTFGFWWLTGLPSLHFVSFPIHQCNIRVFGAIFFTQK